jgi:hypothetical protein
VAGLEAGEDQAPEPAEAAQPVEPSVDCHSGAVAQAFRPEVSASSPNSPLATHHSSLPQTPAPSPTSAHRPQTPSGHTAPSYPACHPEHSDTGPSTPQPAPNRGARALHFDQSCRLLIDGKPF